MPEEPPVRFREGRLLGPGRCRFSVHVTDPPDGVAESGAVAARGPAGG